MVNKVFLLIPCSNRITGLVVQLPLDEKNGRSFVIRQNSLVAPPLPPGLYLVSTPIGNLGDITLRALETLAASDVIACEDTRTSGILLSRYGINRPKTSYNEHNADKKGDDLVRQMLDGRSIALISDAGTPLVSDPGARLVHATLKAGIEVIPIPGASAPIAALVASGLPNSSFTFCGFLPAKQGARKRQLEVHKQNTATLVFFESPKRLTASLADMVEVFGGERHCVVARELTKIHETFYRDTLAGLANKFGAENTPKGEIVILVEEASFVKPDEADIDRSLAMLLKDLPTRAAAAILAEQTGLSKRSLYQRALAIGRGNDEN